MCLWVCIYWKTSNAFVFSLSYNNRWPARLFSFLSDAFSLLDCFLALQSALNSGKCSFIIRDPLNTMAHPFNVYKEEMYDGDFTSCHMIQHSINHSPTVTTFSTERGCLMNVSHEHRITKGLLLCNGSCWGKLLLNCLYYEIWKVYDLVLGVLNNRFTCMRGFNMHLHFSTTLKWFVQRFIS